MLHQRSEIRLTRASLLVVALANLVKRRPKAAAKLAEGERRLKLA